LASIGFMVDAEALIAPLDKHYQSLLVTRFVLAH